MYLSFLFFSSFFSFLLPSITTSRRYSYGYRIFVEIETSRNLEISFARDRDLFLIISLFAPSEETGNLPEITVLLNPVTKVVQILCSSPW